MDPVVWVFEIHTQKFHDVDDIFSCHLKCEIYVVSTCVSWMTQKCSSDRRYRIRFEDFRQEHYLRHTGRYSSNVFKFWRIFYEAFLYSIYLSFWIVRDEITYENFNFINLIINFLIKNHCWNLYTVFCDYLKYLEYISYYADGVAVFHPFTNLFLLFFFSNVFFDW